MINKSEANLVSFKVLLTRDNKIVTEFSMLPENMVDETLPNSSYDVSVTGNNSLSTTGNYNISAGGNVNVAGEEIYLN